MPKLTFRRGVRTSISTRFPFWCSVMRTSESPIFHPCVVTRAAISFRSEERMDTEPSVTSIRRSGFPETGKVLCHSSAKVTEAVSASSQNQLIFRMLLRIRKSSPDCSVAKDAERLNRRLGEFLEFELADLQVLQAPS